MFIARAQQAGLALWHMMSLYLQGFLLFICFVYVSLSTKLTVCFLLFLSLSSILSFLIFPCPPVYIFCPLQPLSSLSLSLSLHLFDFTFLHSTFCTFFSPTCSLPLPALPKFDQRRSQFDSVSLVIQGSMEGEMSLMDNLSGSICHFYALPPKFSRRSSDKKVNNLHSDDLLPPFYTCTWFSVHVVGGFPNI